MWVMLGKLATDGYLGVRNLGSLSSEFTVLSGQYIEVSAN